MGFPSKNMSTALPLPGLNRMEYLGRTDFVQVKPSKDEDVVLELESKNREQKSENRKQKTDGNVVPLSIRTSNLEPRTSNSPNEHLSTMMGDAPFCDSCGHVTVRNGSCYRCLNCGNSMGCS